MVQQSVTAMWQHFLDSLGDNADQHMTYTAWPFGGNRNQARELARLVKSGEKTATSSLHLLYEMDHEPVPKVDEYSIITDWDGEAEAIIQNVDVKIIPFHEADQVLARKEGEGDKSLTYWRRVHIDFFTEELEQLGKVFNEDMLIVCETFRVVYQ